MRLSWCIWVLNKSSDRQHRPMFLYGRDHVMLFFSVSRCVQTLLKRPFSCWCNAYSRVRVRGVGSQSSRSDLLVPGCTSTKQTSRTEDQFTVTASAGIRNHEKRIAEIVVGELKRTKPGEWGCVQARGSRSVVNWGGDSHVVWTLLDLQIWDGSW